MSMTSSTLSIRVDSAQKKRLEALAKSTGRSRSYLAADAISAYSRVLDDVPVPKTLVNVLGHDNPLC